MPNQTTVCAHCGLLNVWGTPRCAGCGYPLPGNSPPLPSPAFTPPDSGATAASTPTGLLAPGTLLRDRYKILSLAGTGGMGAVYSAADFNLGDRTVAIKEMREIGLTPQEVIEATNTFHQEARLLASLHHPSLPNIHDHFNVGARWYLVMDFIDGETLQQYLARSGSPGLPVAEVLRLADQICAVLEFLHRQDPPIIFRDLKPGNIMVTATGQLYLIDFGIARLFKPGQATDTISLGSAGYAAPEQYGRSQTTVQSDIYSLGVTLHQLLTGQDPALKPFALTPIRPYSPDIPPQLESLVLSMVQMDEARRPANISQVRQVLRQLSQQISSVRLVRPIPPPYQTSPGPDASTRTSASRPVTSKRARSAPADKPNERRGRPRRGFRVMAILAAALLLVCVAAVVCSTASQVLRNVSQSESTADAESTMTSQQEAITSDEAALSQSVGILLQIPSFSEDLAAYDRNWKRMQGDYKQEQSDVQAGCRMAGIEYQVKSVDVSKIQADYTMIQADDTALATESTQMISAIQQVQSRENALQIALKPFANGDGATSASLSTTVTNARAALTSAQQLLNQSRIAMQSAEDRAQAYDQDASSTVAKSKSLADTLHC